MSSRAITVQFVSWICFLKRAVSQVFLYHACLPPMPFLRILLSWEWAAGSRSPVCSSLPSREKGSGRAAAGQLVVGGLGFYFSILRFCSIAWAVNPSPLTGDVIISHNSYWDFLPFFFFFGFWLVHFIQFLEQFIIRGGRFLLFSSSCCHYLEIIEETSKQVISTS